MKRTDKRLYEAAQVSDFHVGAKQTGTADYVVNHAGYRLRDYARWLDENSDIAGGALDVLINNIVGTGIALEPQAQTKRGKPVEALNERIRTLWEEWTRFPEITQQMPWGELQRMVCRSWLRDGELFVEHIDGEVRANRRRSIPYCLRLLEADWLPYETYSTTDNIVHGIEKDEDGIPTAFHFHKQQSDPRWLTVSTLKNLREVPAERIEHLKFARRLNQTRGVTIFHSVIRRLEDIKDAEDSERIAMRIAAAWTAAITRNPDMIDDFRSFTPQTEESSSTTDAASRFKDRYFEVGPGTVWDNLLPGEDIKAIGLDRPNTNLIEFLNDQHRRIASGIGVSHSSLSKRYDGTYSAQRQEMVEQAPAYGRLRNYFIDTFMRPVYERFLFWCVESGSLMVPRSADPLRWMKADFRAPALPWIDPKKEIEADQVAVESGFKSRHMVIRERGYDPELVDQQIAADTYQPKNTEPEPAAPPPPPSDDTEAEGEE